jgi:DNA helicase-2/ATP-dependent DNA helicase PcrA
MNFEAEYKKLNKAQKQAVDTVEGPVMVVAGPGTGKTQILTLRIANILKKTQVEPENILALTFTEAGASQMRKRLAEMIGTPAYRVTIGTFHGFCNDIIKQNPSAFPRIIGSESITEVDQIGIIEQAINELPLTDLRPYGDPYYYIRPILSSINELKREGVSPDEFKSIIANELFMFDHIEDLHHVKGAHKGKIKGDYQKLQKQLNRNAELERLYMYYQERLAAMKLYDFSDMILEVIKKLSEDQDLLLQLQEQYQYILVDEHQDTNNAQNKLVELLCNFHPDPNLFVVGDEKQAIFRFQGASLENFLYFKKLYPRAKMIVLEENYRSHQSILDAAHNLIAGPKQLKAQKNKKAVQIRLGEFSKPDEELFYLASDIYKCINPSAGEGTPAEEIAVLYRENRDSLDIARALEKMGVPYVIESDQDIMVDPDIRKLLLLFRTIVNFGSDEYLLESLHIDFLGFEPLDVYQLIEESNRTRVPAHQVVKIKFPELYKKLSGWATMSHNENAERVFEEVVRESGYLASILKKVDAGDKLDRTNALFDELKSLSNRRDGAEFSLSIFLKYLDTLRTHNILLKKPSISAPGRVRLMTAHRSKGQEFDTVYIVHAFDGHWGHKRRAQLIVLPDKVFIRGELAAKRETTEDDERRLFYVALTRARKDVIITYAQESRSGQQQLPSQFITEIKRELIKPVKSDDIKKELSKHKDFFFTAAPAKEPDIKNKEFIRQLFTLYGLSVTGLNNYLECPWKYFYTNLLRIPKAKTKHQMYGTAIHRALKDFFDEAKPKIPSLEFLLNKFETYLNEEPLKEAELAESLKKGQKALRGWYENYHTTWNLNTRTEYGIKGVLLAPDVRITGKIDKMELGNTNLVNVVDYKTSKPKTRGEIEGTTQTSNGDIKRQVVFYKLLLDRYEDLPNSKAGGKRYKMESAEIDFIEPDEKGRYKKEPILVSKEEVSALEELIKKTADEILNLKFWTRICDDKDCEFCALRKLM